MLRRLLPGSLHLQQPLSAGLLLQHPSRDLLQELSHKHRLQVLLQLQLHIPNLLHDLLLQLPLQVRLLLLPQQVQEDRLLTGPLADKPWTS